MKVRIFEVFTSIEGEGLLYGKKTLFVRLAGCPLRCFYCDTPEALPPDSGKEYDLDEACQMIDERLDESMYKVNFTGGEPLIQYEAVAKLAEHVRSKKVLTYLESSCYDYERFAHVAEHIDILKVEFKTRDSKVVDDKHYEKMITETAKCLELAANSKQRAYVKIVASSRTTDDEFAELLDTVFSRASPDSIEGLFVQPTTGTAEPRLEQLLRFYDIANARGADVRVVPQLHKLMGAI